MYLFSRQNFFLRVLVCIKKDSVTLTIEQILEELLYGNENETMFCYLQQIEVVSGDFIVGRASTSIKNQQ